MGGGPLGIMGRIVQAPKSAQRELCGIFWCLVKGFRRIICVPMLCMDCTTICVRMTNPPVNQCNIMRHSHGVCCIG